MSNKKKFSIPRGKGSEPPMREARACTSRRVRWRQVCYVEVIIFTLTLRNQFESSRSIERLAQGTNKDADEDE